MPPVTIIHPTAIPLRSTLPMLLFPLPVFPMASVLLLSKRHAPQTTTFSLLSASLEKSPIPTISPSELSFAALEAA